MVKMFTHNSLEIQWSTNDLMKHVPLLLPEICVCTTEASFYKEPYSPFPKMPNSKAHWTFLKDAPLVYHGPGRERSGHSAPNLPWEYDGALI